MRRLLSATLVSASIFSGMAFFASAASADDENNFDIFQLQREIQNSSEVTAMLQSITKSRHDTAKSIVNNIR